MPITTASSVKKEAVAAKEIDLSSVTGISSLKGIEYFTSLVKLIVRGGSLDDQIDFRSFPMLEVLELKINL